VSVSAGWSLQRALVSELKSSGELSALLGGPKVYDRPPQRVPVPCVTLGYSVVRDWSSCCESGLEHLVTLHVWTGARGRKKAWLAVNVIRELLHDVELPLEGHVLVNLRCEFCDVRMDGRGEHYHGLVRFRAVTEPVG